MPPYGFTPAPRRSAIPKVIGILMIVLCSLAVVINLFGLAAGPDKTFEHLPEWKKLQDTGHVMSLIQLPLTLFGLATGIMAVRYRRVAPKLALSYAIISGLHTVVNVVVMYPLTQKALHAAMDRMGGGYMNGAVNAGMGIGLVLNLIVGLAWSIVIGVLMTRPGAKAACVH